MSENDTIFGLFGGAFGNINVQWIRSDARIYKNYNHTENVTTQNNRHIKKDAWKVQQHWP